MNFSEKTGLKRPTIAMLSIHSSPLGPLGAKNTGGMSVVVRETALALGALGHRVDIYTAASAGNLKQVVALSGNVRLIHLNCGPREPIPKSAQFRHLPKYYDELKAFVAAEGGAYDLLHSHYWLSARLGAWAQEAWQVPHVVTFHTLGWLKNRLGPTRDETDHRIDWECRLARTCHRILVATEAEKVTLVNQCRMDADKVGVVPFGVDAATFDIGSRRDARKRVGLTMAAAVILFVGRFVSLKGIERLMEAVAKMPPHDDVRLLILGGDGPDAASTLRLETLARHLGIDGRVVIPGRIEHAELVTYYNAADVVVIPSYYESFGLVVLESLACGTPVVATPVGVVESVVRTGQNGIVVRDQTPAGIAQALSQVLTWTAQGRLRPKDVRRSVMNFNWPVVANAIVDQYACAADALRLEKRPDS